jgi:hypothetical protein
LNEELVILFFFARKCLIFLCFWGGFLFWRSLVREGCVDGIADFKSSGLDVGGGELAGFFSGDFEVCGAVFEAYGCKDGASRDVPDSIGLD